MAKRWIKGKHWDVFETNSADGSMQIQGIDEKDRDDIAAVEHVIRRAKAGDARAISALWEVLPYDGLVNRVLWCQAMGWRGKDDADWPDGFDERWGHLEEVSLVRSDSGKPAERSAMK